MQQRNQIPVHARRIGPTVEPDRARVLLRPFYPSTDAIARRIITRAEACSDEEVAVQWSELLGGFADRHHGLETFCRARYRQVCRRLGHPGGAEEARQALIGAHFTHEYSPEAAALFNPSIVAHPDQTGLSPGSLRFVLSLRATGEGHISSITFRTGIVSSRHRVTLTPTARFATEPAREPNVAYENALFARKLVEAGVASDFSRTVMAGLTESFSLDELRNELAKVVRLPGSSRQSKNRSARGMLLLAESNYDVQFAAGSELSQRILFPSSASQSNGIEDARFVRFVDDDGLIAYYATYTAYDGEITLPQLVETSDFVHFKFRTLNGPAVQNKGMALFPRKIGGRYVMLSRQDDENILLMHSDNLHFWQTPKVLLSPTQPWEFVKLGNCGSPIETRAGWLVLSHGVGAMRKYCIGAFLLDLDDPSRVIGRLREPLLSPNEAEREGYVPNVVYTCGAMLHGSELLIPYAMSDYAASFASVPLDEVLAAME
ncbi:MAG: glycoside hydrolase family 130 protein [Verrucomicrobiae bacterium]|nr:glycoside hydrolase family 130 protein [Verrucomicrobiae bacterium]